MRKQRRSEVARPFGVVAVAATGSQPKGFLVDAEITLVESSRWAANKAEPMTTVTAAHPPSATTALAAQSRRSAEIALRSPATPQKEGKR
jgi:hypothetical protein